MKRVVIQASDEIKDYPNLIMNYINSNQKYADRIELMSAFTQSRISESYILDSDGQRAGIIGVNTDTDTVCKYEIFVKSLNARTFNTITDNFNRIAELYDIIADVVNFAGVGHYK